MVETGSQENSRIMEERLQVIEQKIGTFNDLQELVETLHESVQGYREELQMVQQGMQQNLEALAQEIRALALTVQPFENPMTDLTHLQQTGSLSEFNVRFDSIVQKLDLSESYSVEADVGALKEEIANFVQLFQPRTIHQARLLARTQEIFLHRQAEEARKALEDQSQKQTPLFIKTEAQEGPIDHKAFDKVQDDDKILQPPVPTQDIGNKKEKTMRLRPTMSTSTERTREVKTSSCDFGRESSMPDLVSVFRNPGFGETQKQRKELMGRPVLALLEILWLCRTTSLHSQQ